MEKIEKNPVNKKRIDFLDIAKGIGIIWVLIGHSKGLLIPFSGDIAFSFHMPLFFIISGYCFKTKDHIVYGLLKRLINPFYVTIALFVIWFIIKGDYKESLNWVWGGIYGSGYDYITPFFIKGVGGIWFFWALFWAKLILNRIVNFPEHICILLVSLLAMWGVISYKYFVLPLEIQNGCIGILFYT